MEKLSLVIITYNEEEHLASCLESVAGIADDILILDSFSTDRTKDIALAAGARFEEHAFDGYISQKNRALKMARHDLVLSLDGDEALSPEAQSIITEIKKDRQADGYSFRRKNKYCGKWMKYTSQYPDRKIRLFDRQKAHWAGYDPHDYIQMETGARLHRLSEDLLHWVYRDKAEHQDKARRFASIAAGAYNAKGKHVFWVDQYTHSIWRFVYEYFVRLGFLEGKRGLQFSAISATYVYLKYKQALTNHEKRSSKSQ